MSEIERLEARVAELEEALVDCVIELTELVNPSYGPLMRARAALANAPACPAGGYTGQPSTEEPTVENCLKAGVCGCDVGAALK